MLVKEITAALVAQYAALPGAPNWPKTLAAETCGTQLEYVLVEYGRGVGEGELTMLPPSPMAFS